MIIKKNSLMLPTMGECTHAEYNNAPIIIQVDGKTYRKTAWTQGSMFQGIWTGMVIYKILFNNN